MNPKFKCPYCGEVHRKSDCSMKCEYRVPGTRLRCYLGAEMESQIFDSNGYITKRYRSKCERCTRANVQYYCPMTNRFVPYAFFAGGSNAPISLIGTKYSGKSHYIAVLVEEIRRKMTRPFKCALTVNCDDASAREYTSRYHDPLYVKHSVLPVTDSGDVTPMMFPLDFNDTSGKSAILTLYDTAGEDLRDLKSISMKRYLGSTDGMIMLVDPLQIRMVRETLTQNGYTGSLPDEGMLASLLDGVTQALCSFLRLRGRKKIKIPLAVVFTKSDMLKEYGIISDRIDSPTACLCRESTHITIGKYSMREHAMTQAAVSQLIDKYAYSELTSTSRYANVGYFCVSALGDNPQASGKLAKEAEPKPLRVLDPLLWIMAQNKLIATTDD